MTGLVRLWTLVCLPGLFGQLLSSERDYQLVKIQQELLGSIRNPIMTLTQSMVQNQLDQCNATINLLETKMREMEQRLQAQETRQQEGRIGFYIFITFESSDDVIMFDRVVLNEGNMYNSTTGIVTCPLTGTYHFVWSVQIQNTDWGHVLVDFKVNGDTKGFTITFGPKEHTSTNSVVLRLQHGDRVWLQKRSMDNIRIAAYETSFSGHFLYH